MTVNAAVAVSAGTLPTSLPDRTTVYAPGAIDGTVNVHVKVPVEEVVTEVQVWVAGVAPLNVIVPIVVRTENPEPVTVTEVPKRPWTGDRVIVGSVTVNVAEALFELASVAVTVLPPAVEEGTTKVAVKVPVADEVTVAGTVATVAPLNFIIMVEEGMKLEPVTVTVVPTAPWTGDRVIVEVRTTKVAEALFELASVAVTVLPPAVEEGTTKVAVKVPVADEVTVAGTVATVAPLNFIVMAEAGARPAPVTVTVVPTGPEIGDRVIDDVTVNVADALYELASVAVTT
jgi:peptidyl-tRNA hydrolase